MRSSSLFDSEFLKSLGVLDWGYTEDPIPQSLANFESWASQGKNGPLGYLNDHRRALRRDLRTVYPDFGSALVFLFSYQSTKKWMLENNKHQIAGYALGFEGEDYHQFLKERLKRIADSLNGPGLKYFFSLDAQPVLERDLAYRAGLGWFGKNSMLIHPKEGSYFIIGSLLLNQKLSIEDSPVSTDHCGNCRACVDACPTDAIDVESRTLRASQCISTYTIELFKDAPAPKGFENSRGEIFGCDICQDVCPWNRKPLERVDARLNLGPQYEFLKEILYGPKEKLYELIFQQTNRGLKKKFSGTPFDRPGKEGWLKNLRALNSKDRN